MDTKTSVNLTEEMLNRIEEYRRKIPGRIPSRNEAIQDLLQIGLNSWEQTNHHDQIGIAAQEGNPETKPDA
ncbi:MAG: ribbon-helix-helix domain-containing protein [Bacilli bacterium]